MITVVIPARAAASSFSLSPPTGSTAPQRDLAGHRDVVPHRRRPRAATPARRPWSRPPTVRPWAPRPPARGCGSRARRRTRSLEPQRQRVRARERQRGHRRLLHDVAELAGEDERALARPSTAPRRAAPRRRTASRPGPSPCRPRRRRGAPRPGSAAARGRSRSPRSRSPARAVSAAVAAGRRRARSRSSTTWRATLRRAAPPAARDRAARPRACSR